MFMCVLQLWMCRNPIICHALEISSQLVVCTTVEIHGKHQKGSHRQYLPLYMWQHCVYGVCACVSHAGKCHHHAQGHKLERRIQPQTTSDSTVIPRDVCLVLCPSSWNFWKTMYRIEKISKINSKLPYFYVCGYMCYMQVSKLNLLCIQNTMPQMEEVAVDKVAYIIFPWQVEQVLHKVSRGGLQGSGGWLCKLHYVWVAQCTSTIASNLSSLLVYRDILSRFKKLPRSTFDNSHFFNIMHFLTSMF